MEKKDVVFFKGLLRVANSQNRRKLLEEAVFPYISAEDSNKTRDLCDSFGVSVSEYQTWKRLCCMPDDHIRTIRRRVEDRLRKATPYEVLSVADMLGVKTQ